MKLRYIKNSSYAFLSLLLFGASLTSCVYDDFPENGNSSSGLDTSGFTLGLTVKLDEWAGTRTSIDYNNDLDRYDSWIDTESKFRVLFFDAAGNFIFEAVDRTVMPKEDGYYVHIPVNYVVDSKGMAYDVDALKRQLKENDFKVAVLANWPKGDPVWGVNESILRDPSTAKNINDLHHCTPDTYYANTSSSSRPSRAETYDFIMNDGKMGVKTNWVRGRMLDADKDPDGYVEPYNLSSQAVALEWIRENWNPNVELNNNRKIYRHYQYLWYLWDFDASFKIHIDPVKYPVSLYGGEKWGREWYGTDPMTNEVNSNPNRRGARLAERIMNFDKNNLDADGKFITAQYASKSYSISDDDAKFRFTAKDDKTVRVNRYNGNYGIVMPEGKANANITFEATTSGTLIVKASSDNSDRTSELSVYLSGKQSKLSLVGSQLQTNSVSFRVTEDAQEVSIYSTSGNSVIYSIEFIKDQYLYESDRKAVIPNAEQPIPMYGVQNYGKLEKWETGTTFDISSPGIATDPEYNFKNISLIRALSKIEVYLPEDENGDAPKHVYLRSINRMARCEPVNVETPTNLIWNESFNDYEHRQPGNRCEFWNIQEHGPTLRDYTGSEGSGWGEIDNYTNHLSWFYGSWLSTSWKDGMSWDFTAHNSNGVKVTPTDQGNPYPNIFNSDIERSDYAEMIYIGKVNGLHKYVMYMPDKNIDDPNYPGIMKCVAKVPHIEYKYPSQDDKSLDNNDCYRLYFADYGTGYDSFIADVISSMKGVDYTEKFERNQETLSHLWPIVRNHIYRFYVSGTRSDGKGIPTVRTTITTFDGHKISK